MLYEGPLSIKTAFPILGFVGFSGLPLSREIFFEVTALSMDEIDFTREIYQACFQSEPQRTIISVRYFRLAVVSTFLSPDLIRALLALLKPQNGSIKRSTLVQVELVRTAVGAQIYDTV